MVCLCFCVFSHRLSYCHDVVDAERCVLCRGTVYRLQAPHDVGHGCGLVAQQTGDCLVGLQRGHVGSADRLGLGAELLEMFEMSEQFAGDLMGKYCDCICLKSQRESEKNQALEAVFEWFPH